MMGGTPTMDYSLRQIMKLIDKSRQRKKPLLRAIEQLDKDPELRIYTTQGYQPIRLAARYWFMLALIWRLLDDDDTADERLKKARICKDRTPALEAEVLYEHITLLVRHGWRLDAVPSFFRRIVALYRDEPELHARALTNWGRFLYGQKMYDEAYAKFTDSEALWTSIQKQRGHVMSRADKQHMMDTNWCLLKTHVARKAKRKTINEVAQKTIRHDRNMHRKFAAIMMLRRLANKTSNG